MGAIGIPQLLLLIVVLSVPVSILAGAVVYLVRLARLGPASVLAEATRRRDFV